MWIDQAVWVRSDASQIDPSGPVPLVSFGEDCSCRYTAVNALHRVGRECDFVFTSRSIASLEAAVLAGLGIMVRSSFTLEDDFSSGRLVQLLKGHHLGRMPVNLVYPSRRLMSYKVRSFVDFMSAQFPAPDTDPWVGLM